MASTLITGANRGIGFEFCRQLSARGDAVIGVCRQSSEGLDSLGVRVLAGVDVTDEDSLRGMNAELGGEKLDLLINNAGILIPGGLEDLQVDDLRKQFEVNTLGPLMVTRELLPRMAKGGKIAIITSLMGSMSDNGSGGYYGYRMSKAAVNMAGVSLARDLQGKGISVFLLHPGMVATEMTNRQGISVEESVGGLLARLDALGPEASGTFWHADGRELGW